MNLFDLILNGVFSLRRWRFAAPLLIAAVIAAAIHFTVGWTPLWIGVCVIVTLAALFTGIVWQSREEDSV